jgi:hypothetical protein
MKRILGIVIFSAAILAGCSPSSPPAYELSVYKDDCHIIGNDVYFSYNGADFVAKNQATGFQNQSQTVTGIDITVIALKDGTYIIPDK